MALTIVTATKLLERLVETLHQYQMQIAADKILWLNVGTDGSSPTTLEVCMAEFQKNLQGQRLRLYNKRHRMHPLQRPKNLSIQLTTKL